MTFSNLCALYENACLDYEVSVLTEGADSEEAKTDYEVSVLTEGADSEEAKTAKEKATTFGKKVFSAIGAAFQKLWEMIVRLLTFIKRRFVRDKVKLAKDVQLVPVEDYKAIIANLAKYIIAGDALSTKAFFAKDVLLMKATSVKAGSIVDKTAYVETLEKLEKLTKKFASLKTKADNFVEKNAGFATENKIEKKRLDAVMYSKMEKYVKNLVEAINTDIQIISNNAVPEDVAPVNDKKGKADTNNESAIFDGLTRNELRAKLLIEAADLLNEGAASKARKEIIKDIKIQKQEDLYKKFKNAKMDYDEAKKYYSILKKEIVTLRNKLAQIPAETAFEKLKMSVGKEIVGQVIGGALTFAIGSNVKGFAGTVMKIGSIPMSVAVIVLLTGAGIAADSALSKIKGSPFNWNKNKALEKLDKFEKKVDNIMEHYEKTHDDEISSKNESIDLFI